MLKIANILRPSEQLDFMMCLALIMWFWVFFRIGNGFSTENKFNWEKFCLKQNHNEPFRAKYPFYSSVCILRVQLIKNFMNFRCNQKSMSFKSKIHRNTNDRIVNFLMIYVLCLDVCINCSKCIRCIVKKKIYDNIK